MGFYEEFLFINVATQSRSGNWIGPSDALLLISFDGTMESDPFANWSDSQLDC